jgi:hypothetical protein
VQVLLGATGALSLMTVISVVIGRIFQSVPAQLQTSKNLHSKVCSRFYSSHFSEQFWVGWLLILLSGNPDPLFWEVWDFWNIQAGRGFDS